MSLFSSPEEHAANAPSTWQIVKQANRRWALTTKDGTVIYTAETRKRVTEEGDSGSTRRLYDKETRWYAGEQVDTWKPWTQVSAEQARHAEWLARRHAAAANG